MTMCVWVGGGKEVRTPSTLHGHRRYLCLFYYYFFLFLLLEAQFLRAAVFAWRSAITRAFKTQVGQNVSLCVFDVECKHKTRVCGLKMYEKAGEGGGGESVVRRVVCVIDAPVERGHCFSQPWGQGECLTSRSSLSFYFSSDTLRTDNTWLHNRKRFDYLNIEK